MAYIPLKEDLRLKGKAAVDCVGDRLGKLGVGVLQQVLLMSIWEPFFCRGWRMALGRV